MNIREFIYGRRALLITAGLLLLGIAAVHFPLKAADVPPRASLAGLPLSLGDWHCIRDQKMDPETMRVLKVDDYVMRDYQGPEGSLVSLYIGYFLEQREGKRIHSPRQCLPGAGWAPVEKGKEMIPIAPGGAARLPANRMVMLKGNDRRVFLFWYQGRGRIYDSEYMNRIYLMLDAFRFGRSDGALITVSALEGQNPGEIPPQQKFVQALYPLLGRYIPE
jgi:EpsI family protein